jgi:hypothetical protein
MLDPAGLIEKHRSKGVLVDTNLLVLFLVGNVNRRRILNFKRTADFNIEDYDLLLRLIDWFGTVVLTPHILSQVSDLTDLGGAELAAVRAAFMLMVDLVEERFDVSRIVVTDPTFERLGLTDAAVATVGSRGLLVLTADAHLHRALQERDIDSLNFGHVRMLGW